MPPKPAAVRKPERTNRYYDNTMLGTYKDCPRKYFLRHVRGWRSEGTSEALIFGLSWHEAQNVVWTHIANKDVPNEVLRDLAYDAFVATWVGEGLTHPDQWTMADEDRYAPRTPGIAREMLHNYIELRRPMLMKAKVLNIEQPFAVPLFSDKADVWYIGRKDKKMLLNGDVIIVEHKTTSAYKSDGGFRNDYIEGWSPNSQCEGYLYSEQFTDKPARYIWVDAALVHKKVHDKFKFIPLSLTTAAMDGFLWEARDWVQRIESELERSDMIRDQSHMTCFPKNTESCSGKYGLCTYIHLCRAIPRPDLLTEPPPGFIEDRWEPFDVLEMEKIGMKK